MFDPGPCVYMEKIAVGPDCVGVVDIRKSITENLEAVAKAKHESVRDVTAVILDRDRHEDLIKEVREAGRASASSLTVTWPAPSRRRGRTPAPTCCSASAARLRASSPPPPLQLAPHA